MKVQVFNNQNQSIKKQKLFEWQPLQKSHFRRVIGRTKHILILENDICLHIRNKNVTQEFKLANIPKLTANNTALMATEIAKTHLDVVASTNQLFDCLNEEK